MIKTNDCGKVPDASATGLDDMPPHAWTTPLNTGLSFVVVSLGLVLRNAATLGTRLYESGDAAANSLLVIDAKSLSLLVGHYSRLGFNHPGPAVLYMQASGELLFYDLLGIVPGPFNGQVLAVLLFQAAVVSAIVGVLSSWSGRWPVGPAVLAVLLLWFALHEFALSSTWMPHVVVAPFLLLIVAGGSVAAGNGRHLWLLALSAGVLVHAHIAFALFAPLLTLAALISWAVTERLGPRALYRRSPKSSAAALVLVAIFAAPILANTLRNWPGEVGKYLSYSGDQGRRSPSIAESLQYARGFWILERGDGWLFPLLLVLSAGLAIWCAPEQLRRPLAALAGSTLVAAALFFVYVFLGIDDLSQNYIGLFSWSIPLGLLLTITLSAAHRAASSRWRGGILVLVAVLLAGVALSSDGYRLYRDDVPGLRQTAIALEQVAAGRTIVLDIGPGAGPFVEAAALLVHYERQGVPACAATIVLRVQLTGARVCSPEEQDAGITFRLDPPDTQTGGPAIQGQRSRIVIRS